MIPSNPPGKTVQKQFGTVQKLGQILCAKKVHLVTNNHLFSAYK